jgi:hypothetical protein
MIKDFEYPADARRTIDALQNGLRYDAAIAIGGDILHRSPIPDQPNFSTGIRHGGLKEDQAVLKEAPGLLSRFSLVSMVS